jgi:hypothetical protein
VAVKSSGGSAATETVVLACGEPVEPEAVMVKTPPLSVNGT